MAPNASLGGIFNACNIGQAQVFMLPQNGESIPKLILGKKLTSIQNPCSIHPLSPTWKFGNFSSIIEETCTNPSKHLPLNKTFILLLDGGSRLIIYHEDDTPFVPYGNGNTTERLIAPGATTSYGEAEKYFFLWYDPSTQVAKKLAIKSEDANTILKSILPPVRVIVVEKIPNFMFLLLLKGIGMNLFPVTCACVSVYWERQSSVSHF